MLYDACMYVYMLYVCVCVWMSLAKDATHDLFAQRVGGPSWSSLVGAFLRRLARDGVQTIQPVWAPHPSHLLRGFFLGLLFFGPGYDTDHALLRPGADYLPIFLQGKLLNVVSRKLDEHPVPTVKTRKK